MDKLDEINALIQRMAAPDTFATGSENVSWQAHREAEEIAEVSWIPKVLEFIGESKNEKETGCAYTLLFYILQNSPDHSLINQLTARLQSLEAYPDLLYKVLMGIWESGAPLTQNIEHVICLSTDDREMVRIAAIRVLGNYVSEQEQCEEALLNVAENYYDHWDLRYAAAGLEKMKSKKAAPLLEKALEDIENEETIYMIEQCIKRLKK